MTILRVLYLEDEQTDLYRYRPVLTRAWEKNPALVGLGTLEVELVDSPEKAIESLKAKGEAYYTLFVADLLFKRDPSDPSKGLVDDGLMAVEYCASSRPKIVIVAVSIAEGTKGFGGITKQFQDQGGDLYFSKDWIDHEPDKKTLYDKIGKDIEGVLRSKNHFSVSEVHEIAEVPLNTDKGNMVLQAQLESVGDHILKSIVKSIAPECGSLSINYVDPGMSGAFVFKVISYSHQNFSGTCRELLLKIAKDGHSLKQELSKVPEHGLFTIGTIPGPAVNEIVEKDGWYAIAYEFVGEAISLHTWLTKETPPQDKLEAFFCSLFNELKKMYMGRRFKEQCTALDILAPSTAILARAVVATNELWPLIQKYCGKQGENLRREVIDEFIQQRGGQLSAGLSMETLVCMSHGDLHSGNILVGLRYIQPHMIDFSERGEKHWASDCAQLASSLLIRGWDYGINSWEFEHLSDWHQVFNNWLSASDISSSIEDRNLGIWHSLSWLRNNIQEIWGNILTYAVPISEFHLALVTEFLQLAGQIERPAPKRALALLAVHDIISKLELSPPKKKRGNKK